MFYVVVQLYYEIGQSGVGIFEVILEVKKTFAEPLKWLCEECFIKSDTCSEKWTWYTVLKTEIALFRNILNLNVFLNLRRQSGVFLLGLAETS